MAEPKRNTIWLSTRNIWDKEAPLATGATITPGMLLQFDGANNTVEPHAAAGEAPQPLMVAVEAVWKYGGGIDEPYDTVGEQVDFCYPLSGDIFLGLLADEENAAQNALLVSAGNGQLAVAGVDEVAIGRALDAVNNTGGSGPKRIRVEVI
jgi:hypothetical protein